MSISVMKFIKTTTAFDGDKYGLTEALEVYWIAKELGPSFVGYASSVDGFEDAADEAAQEMASLMDAVQL